MKALIPLAMVALVAAGTATDAFAAARAEKTGDTLVMQNDLVSLTIDLKKGARVSQFVYKPFGGNIVYPV